MIEKNKLLTSGTENNGVPYSQGGNTSEIRLNGDTGQPYILSNLSLCMTVLILVCTSYKEQSVNIHCIWLDQALRYCLIWLHRAASRIVIFPLPPRPHPPHPRQDDSPFQGYFPLFWPNHPNPRDLAAGGRHCESKRSSCPRAEKFRNSNS